MSQREIKFRAWDNERKIMLWTGVFDLNWYQTEKNDEAGCHTDVAKTQKDRKVLELMQYTGLKDKNGKEIYEGDICSSHDDGNGKIVWQEFEWVYEFSDGNVVGMWEVKNGIEIIGNIYEKPNLLKEV